MFMKAILIADDNLDSCNLMATYLTDAGYDVSVTSSAAKVLEDVLKKTAQVVLMGNVLDEIDATELIPLLKKCNRDLSIIFVSGEASLSLVRKLRNDGIFYHALPPEETTEQEELKQVIQCAFETVHHHTLH
jgi:DNA-binding NtrC family response regulator